MLSLLAIFIVNLVLLFALFKASSLIFTFQDKSNFKESSIYVTVGSFVVLFLLSVIITFGTAKLVTNLIPSQRLQASALAADIDLQDCPKLLDTIALFKKETVKLANHRNIEETSPLFTIKLEYEKGAAKLKESATILEQLSLAAKTQQYTQSIVLNMQEKAKYFTQRASLKEDKEGTKQIANLLKKMDRVTQEQQIMMENIEKKCNI